MDGVGFGNQIRSPVNSWELVCERGGIRIRFRRSVPLVEILSGAVMGMCTPLSYGEDEGEGQSKVRGNKNRVFPDRGVAPLKCRCDVTPLV